MESNKSALKVKWRATPWKKHKGIYVADTWDKCHEVLESVLGLPVCGVDVETYGCDPKKMHPKGLSRIASIQFAGPTGTKYFVPVWGHYEENLQVFKEWLEDPKIKNKVFHNGKWDMHALANHGIILDGLLGDTLVMDFLAFNGEELHGLKECMRRYFNDPTALDFREVFRTRAKLKKPRKNKETGELEIYGKKTYVPDMLEVIQTAEGIDKLVQYSVKDPQFTAKLYLFLKERLEKMPWAEQGGKKYSYFYFYEKIPLVFTKVLFDVEREGCPLDLVHLKEAQDRIQKDIKQVERDFLYDCVTRGVAPSMLEKFSISSGSQVQRLLYEELKLPVEMRTPKGQPAVGVRALERIVARAERSKRAKKNAELVSKILRHRQLSKIKGTYLDVFLKKAPLYDGRIHTTLKQTGTVTGRLSSATPNLQNIPANKKDDEYSIRKSFIAHHPDYVVVDIDLAQIEVRLTAHFTREEKLIQLLKNGWDQHLIAMMVLYPEVKKFVGDRAPDKKVVEEGEKKFGKAIWNEWRRNGKIFNFGVIYGMGPKGAAMQSGGKMSEEEAKVHLANYMAGFPGLARGIERTKRSCYEKGYVKTYLGRYVMIPDIRSSEWSIKGHAERLAFNSRCQGSAADLLMLGMILCWQDPDLRAWDVKMILQIHDELVFLAPRAHVEKAKPIIDEYISHPYRHMHKLCDLKMKDLVVDTPADAGWGPNWAEAKA